MNLEKIKKRAEYIYNLLQPYCVAIYLGGSMVDKYIKHPHDIDFITFVSSVFEIKRVKNILQKEFQEHPENILENEDFIQIHIKDVEQRAYGNYINKMMIKLVGENIQFDFDIIDKDRKYYIDVLNRRVNILSNLNLNQKRWYQVARGIFILQNNSYKLTNSQSKILNEIHDMTDGWEKYKVEIIKWLKKLNEKSLLH